MPVANHGTPFLEDILKNGYIISPERAKYERYLARIEIISDALRKKGKADFNDDNELVEYIKRTNPLDILVDVNKISGEEMRKILEYPQVISFLDHVRSVVFFNQALKEKRLEGILKEEDFIFTAKKPDYSLFYTIKSGSSKGILQFEMPNNKIYEEGDWFFKTLGKIDLKEETEIKTIYTIGNLEYVRGLIEKFGYNKDVKIRQLPEDKSQVRISHLY
ncbi:MAG: hypothetical protein WA139_05075 [Candidatus Aenigmatarchaeota archaeon]